MSREPPPGWVELETGNDWELVRLLGGFIVISDEVNDRAEGGPKYHHRGCKSVKLTHFVEKVLDARAAGRRPRGRYFWVASERVARDGAARACELDGDPMYLS